jgi:protein O-GlcNAcase/histone acetyltransferase
MMKPPATEFFAGVIEGFYGPPWTQQERLECFAWMRRWGLNTYLYGPKDDLKHRAIWREPYSPTEAAAMQELIQACGQQGLRFVYALGPGLDIRYSNESDVRCLTARLEQMLGLGCPSFALLFDDIPDRVDAADLARWGSLASAQCYLVNALFRWARERRPDARFLFCPTPYCGRMADAHHGGPGYLETVGRELLPEIDVFWTGPEIISREISVAQAEAMGAVLRRPPLIWDNLHANDYDGRRFFCGPYAGRPPELKRVVRGLLSNPNCEFPLNHVPLRTLAEYVRAEGSWNPRQAYLSAMQEWWAQFATCGQPIALGDLILFGDCHYLPHEEGPEAEALYRQVEQLLSQPPTDWGEAAAIFRLEAVRLRDCCARLAELQDRRLFYALSRRVWELREEMDLLERYVAFRSAHPAADALCTSDFHLPQTYRGGMVARLQRLLIQQPDGGFRPRQPDRARATSPQDCTRTQACL